MMDELGTVTGGLPGKVIVTPVKEIVRDVVSLLASKSGRVKTLLNQMVLPAATGVPLKFDEISQAGMD
jgi:hypothetical protein